MKPLHSVLTLSLLVLALAGCGGSSITFPQGPTSGAGNLGMGLPFAAVESQASFNLDVDFSTDTNMLTFEWTAANNSDCESYRIIFTPSPPFPEGPVAQVNISYQVGEIDGSMFIAGTGATNFINDTPFSLSALVLCVTNNPSAPFPRSDFENITDLIP